MLQECFFLKIEEEDTKKSEGQDLACLLQVCFNVNASLNGH